MDDRKFQEERKIIKSCSSYDAKMASTGLSRQQNIYKFHDHALVAPCDIMCVKVQRKTKQQLYCRNSSKIQLKKNTRRKRQKCIPLADKYMKTYFSGLVQAH
jgi:hypothetical protein